MRTRKILALVLSLTAALAAITVLGTAADAAACGVPGNVLNLSRWKLQLPIGSGSPREIRQPALATADVAPWFTALDDCSGVQFRNAVNAVTTPNSTYGRSELHEITSSGANPTWSSTSGTHTLTVDQAITHLPNTKPHVVAGQIHNGNDQSTFRLEGTNLYVTNGNNSRFKLIDSGYRLGTRFQARFVVGGGNIRAYYNGTLVATIANSFVNGYFKAGVYTQANCTNSSPCSTANYGEVRVYSVSVSHT